MLYQRRETNRCSVKNKLNKNPPLPKIGMKSTKKLGIIGGMGTRAGMSFMNKVVDYSPAARDQEFIEIILHNNHIHPVFIK